MNIITIQTLGWSMFWFSQDSYWMLGISFLTLTYLFWERPKCACEGACGKPS